MNWAQSVKKRDGYKCVACGSTESLEAHHIIEKYRNSNLEKRLDNGITLCRKCHRAIHKGSFNPKGSKLQPLEVSFKQVQNSIKSHAESKGESVNGFVNRAIDEAMERDNTAE